VVVFLEKRKASLLVQILYKIVLDVKLPSGNSLRVDSEVLSTKLQ
jgi:hypothetical protein